MRQRVSVNMIPVHQPVTVLMEQQDIRRDAGHFAWSFVSLAPIGRHATHPPLNGLEAVGRLYHRPTQST